MKAYKENSSMTINLVKSMIPTVEDVTHALRMHPLNDPRVTSQHREAVKFFYHVVLVAIGGSASCKAVWTKSNNYIDILGANWPTFFGSGLVLLSKYSGLDNIINNSTSSTSDSDTGGAKQKKQRARLMDAKSKRTLGPFFYRKVNDCRALEREEGAKERLKAWDALYSPAAVAGQKLGAKDRPSVATGSHQATAKAEMESDLLGDLLSGPDFEFLQQTGPGGQWGQASTDIQNQATNKVGV